MALIHLFSGKLRFLDVIPRSRWLSVAGGVAVTYALLHLLPELDAYQQVVAASPAAIPLAEKLVYLLTLVGLVSFYGLDKLAHRSKKQPEEDASRRGVFWVHIGSYAFYNALLGYLLVREDRNLTALALYFVGIGLHFVVNDHALRQHHRDAYRRVGRWVLSAAILAGWLAGATGRIPEEATAGIVAFLAGGILLNTFKEELPSERESRFGAFALGAAFYAAVLLAV